MIPENCGIGQPVVAVEGDGFAGNSLFSYFFQLFLFVALVMQFHGSGVLME